MQYDFIEQSKSNINNAQSSIRICIPASLVLRLVTFHDNRGLFKNWHDLKHIWSSRVVKQRHTGSPGPWMWWVALKKLECSVLECSVEEEQAITSPFGSYGQLLPPLYQHFHWLILKNNWCCEYFAGEEIGQHSNTVHLYRSTEVYSSSVLSEIVREHYCDDIATFALTRAPKKFDPFLGGWELLFSARISTNRGRAGHIKLSPPLTWPLWLVCLIRLSL